jgi:hypothetical protein
MNVSLIAVKTPIPYGRQVYNGLAIEEGVQVEIFISSEETGAVKFMRFNNSDKPSLFIMLEDTASEHWGNSDFPPSYLLVSAAS